MANRLAAAGMLALDVGGGVSGVGITVAGVTACPVSFGGGCVAAAGGVILTGVSADYARTHLNTIFTGDVKPTIGAQAISSLLGISPQSAEMLYSFAGAGAGAGSTMLRNAAELTAFRQQYLAARASYGVDGAGRSFEAATIPYVPTGSVVNQGSAPVCGPACTTMMVQDATGRSVSLEGVIGQFAEIRAGGVNVNEISRVLTQNGVANSATTTLTASQLNAELAQGRSVIVSLGGGPRHFVIVDGMRVENGIVYYLTRDPSAGPRGVPSDMFINAMLRSRNAVLLQPKG